MNKYWCVGDKVTWQEYDEDGTPLNYVGTIRDLLSMQMVVHTTKGTDRFVFYRDPTLKPYRQVVT